MNSKIRTIGRIAAVGAVSCGVVYAVPVAVEGFVAPQAKQKDA